MYLVLLTNIYLYLQLCITLKNTIKDLLGLIYSEIPLDSFDHAGCKTAGWAEQVYINCLLVICEVLSY